MRQHLNSFVQCLGVHSFQILAEQRLIEFMGQEILIEAKFLHDFRGVSVVDVVKVVWVVWVCS